MNIPTIDKDASNHLYAQRGKGGADSKLLDQRNQHENFKIYFHTDLVELLWNSLSAVGNDRIVARIPDQYSCMQYTH